MKEERDWGSIVVGLESMRGFASPSSAYAVWIAINSIRRAKCFPEAYVDGLADEMFQMLGQKPPRATSASVYLAFHGADDRAAFMKAGVAVDVKKRMRALYTGCPLPRLWTFSADFKSRGQAYKVEAALHRHLSDAGTSGEWFQVHGLSEEAAEMFAESLAEVASIESGMEVKFDRAEV